MNIYRKIFLFLYLLVLSQKIELIFSDKKITNLKYRPVYQYKVPSSWLESSFTNEPNYLLIGSSDTNLYFEFQDIKGANVYKSKNYKLWNYMNLYSDYIDNVNKMLEPT